jgi:hypothetical protein
MIAALHQIGPLKSLYVCASQMAIHQIACNPWVCCSVMLIFVWRYFHRSERNTFFWQTSFCLSLMKYVLSTLSKKQTSFFMNFLMAVWLSSSDFACYPSLQVSAHKDDENLSICNLGPQKLTSKRFFKILLSLFLIPFVPEFQQVNIRKLSGLKGGERASRNVQKFHLRSIACSRIVWFE